MEVVLQRKGKKNMCLLRSRLHDKACVRAGSEQSRRLTPLRTAAASPGRGAVFHAVALIPLCLTACGPLLGSGEAGSLTSQLQPVEEIVPAGARPPGSARQDARLGLGPGESRRFLSRIDARPDYRLVGLGQSHAGEEWRIELNPAAAQRPEGYILVLFDERGSLLSRSINGYLSHVTRRPATSLVLGITRAPDAPAASFELRIERESGVEVPPPQPQLVLLNFAGGQNVQVRDRPAISFPPFDGALLGGIHTRQTGVLMGAIRERLEYYFAPYNVTFITSDEQPRPEPPYSVIHFGGYDPGSLGLADAVDLYNRDADDSAIVYVHSFIQYASLNLTSRELGYMMGDVAAHELGHLLGLFHTLGPLSLMDNARSIETMVTGSALNLAALAPEVFPYGSLDPVLLLEDGVGRRAGGLAGPAPAASNAVRFMELEGLAKWLRHPRGHASAGGGCGLCAENR